jgi:hypothetical protein
MHNEEFQNVFFSPNIIMIKSWRMRRIWHVSCVETLRNKYNILIEKREGKGALGGSGNGWKNYIQLSLKEGVGWNNLAEDRAQ